MVACKDDTTTLSGSRLSKQNQANQRNLHLIQHPTKYVQENTPFPHQ